MTDRYDPNGYPPYGSQQSGENQEAGGGQGTNPAGASGGYGQPASPSQPFSGGNPLNQYGYPEVGQSGYNQPGPTSQPYGGTPSRPYGGTPSHPYAGQYGQPGPTSQPYTGTPSQPYGQPGPTSQPYGGQYGQPGPTSQPYGGMSPQLYGQPGPTSQPYGGQYGQPDPTSQTLYAQPTAYTQPPTKKSRRGLKIALTVAGIVLVLGAIGGGAAVFLINQIAAPGVAASQFCGDLKSQNYGSAYGRLSASLKSQYPEAMFRAGVTSLDTAEGKVISCDLAQGGNSYSYSLGANTATIGAQLTRGIQGNMTGSLHMKNENGSWKVDGIDTALLGVNIGALQIAGNYCAALQSQDYTTAYGLLDSAQQGLVSKDDFLNEAGLHDQIDGTVTKCALAKVPQGNTDQLARLTIDLNRSKLGDRSGDVTLKSDGKAWKIDTTDAALNGTDLQPLALDKQFCTLLTTGKYGDIYGLLASGFQHAVSKAEFVAEFSSFEGYNLKWACGKPDLATYSVSGDSAKVVQPLTLSIPALGAAATSTQDFTITFTKEDDTWKIEDLAIKS
ncbi:MAG TPA: hypothetical protein VFU63_14600 [Ktedonobacterales bacterium]|nr:hypothetical protein [Ktedonobacterales bacterium]